MTCLVIRPLLTIETANPYLDKTALYSQEEQCTFFSLYLISNAAKNLAKALSFNTTHCRCMEIGIVHKFGGSAQINQTFSLHFIVNVSTPGA